MKYTINKTKRNAIIISSSLLILCVLLLRFFFFFHQDALTDNVFIATQTVIYIVLYGYIVWTFFDYFRHYQLKVLQASILLIFLTEVILKSHLFNNIPDSTWKQTLFLIISAVWMIASVILIVFLFQVRIIDYPGIASIRNYALSMIFLFILATTIPFWAKQGQALSTQQLVELTFVIPFIFTIDFALKLGPEK